MDSYTFSQSLDTTKKLSSETLLKKMHRVEQACIPIDDNVDLCVVNLQQKPIEILDGRGISQLFENRPVKASDQNCAI